MAERAAAALEELGRLQPLISSAVTPPPIMPPVVAPQWLASDTWPVTPGPNAGVSEAQMEVRALLELLSEKRAAVQ